MSLRKAFGPFLALSALTFLAACGGGNGNPAPGNPTPPPTGGLTNSELKGTYVFSISGTDATSGGSYSMAGTFAANGAGSACSTKGAITSGLFDINDFAEFSTPAAHIQITSGNYCVQSDGRGQMTITTDVGQGFPNLTFDFVLQDNTHGLITEFDSFGTGSGTLDLQSATSISAGSYAFLISGATSSGTPFATAGDFTLGSGGAITAGSADCNDGAAAFYPDEPLTGNVVAASSSTPSTTLTASSCTGQAFEVFPIDASHMKIIQMDSTASQSGDIFAQASAMPVGTLAFTLQGTLTGGAAFAAGGFLVTDSTSNITSASSEDFNLGGTLSSSQSSPTFSGAYAVTSGNPGRYTLGTFSGFTGGSSYAAYPSSGGVLLLEIDTAGMTSGAAFAQASGASLATGVGYGLNLSGINVGAATGTVSEVDDIAEFTATSSGTAISGLIDENSTANGPSTYGQPLDGTYTIIGGGRGQILAPTASSPVGLDTLNGDLDLLFYTVDGTTFPFMEYDGGQVSTGVFVKQSATSSSAAAPSHALFVPHPPSHAGLKKRQQ